MAGYIDMYLDVYRSLYAEELRRGTPQGVTEAEIVAAETRLGLRLPRALRDFHRLLGNEGALMAAHNRFFQLSDLAVVSARLVFAEENQAVCVWDVAPNADDPAVEQAQPRWSDEWCSEQLSCSDFLRLMMYLQTACGGYKCHAEHQDIDVVLPALKETWRTVVNHNGLLILQQPGMLVSYLDGNGFLLGAAADDDHLHILMRAAVEAVTRDA